MSFVRTLDESMRALVFEKFASHFGLTDLAKDTILAPKVIQQRKIAEKRGSDTVEFIGIWRRSMALDWQRNNSPVARRGLSLEYSDGGKTSIITAKAVPVSIEYDVWLWTRCLDKLMEATEGYLFWQFNNPNLYLNYMDKYPLELDLHFGPVVDESPYGETYDIGPYFVGRLPVKLDGWIFATFDAKTILTIILKVYLREGTAPHYVDTLLNTYVITPSTSS